MQSRQRSTVLKDAPLGMAAALKAVACRVQGLAVPGSKHLGMGGALKTAGSTQGSVDGTRGVGMAQGCRYTLRAAQLRAALATGARCCRRQLLLWSHLVPNSESGPHLRQQVANGRNAASTLLSIAFRQRTLVLNPMYCLEPIKTRNWFGRAQTHARGAASGHGTARQRENSREVADPVVHVRVGRHVAVVGVRVAHGQHAQACTQRGRAGSRAGAGKGCELGGAGGQLRHTRCPQPGRPQGCRVESAGRGSESRWQPHPHAFSVLGCPTPRTVGNNSVSAGCCDGLLRCLLTQAQGDARK